LMFGLLGAGELEQDEDSNNAPILPSPPFYTSPSFLDPLDDKWRGSPATLWHISKYVEKIARMAKSYSRTTANSYHFARLLMHAIGLRHFAFAYLVSSKPRDVRVRSSVHDPSAIGVLFRYILEPGLPDYSSFALIMILALLAILIFGSVELTRIHRSSLNYVLWFAGFPLAYLAIFVLVDCYTKIEFGTASTSLQSQTSALIANLGTSLLFENLSSFPIRLLMEPLYNFELC
jgi:hypothetical protein